MIDNGSHTLHSEKFCDPLCLLTVQPIYTNTRSTYTHIRQSETDLSVTAISEIGLVTLCLRLRHRVPHQCVGEQLAAALYPVS